MAASASLRKIGACGRFGASEDSAVPRYFFHVHDGRDMPDDVGTVLKGPEEARALAVTAAGEALRDLGDRSRFRWYESHHQAVRDGRLRQQDRRDG